jgi:hypothetical protein
MEDIDPVQESIKLSVEKIIDLVRQLRNDLIKDFLRDPNLQAYFLQQYGKELSVIKTEFCKRDLRELLISPVDLTHYSSLIKEIRETNKASLAAGNHELFYKDLELIFRKYTY